MSSAWTAKSLSSHFSSSFFSFFYYTFSHTWKWELDSFSVSSTQSVLLLLAYPASPLKGNTGKIQCGYHSYHHKNITTERAWRGMTQRKARGFDHIICISCSFLLTRLHVTLKTLPFFVFYRWVTHQQYRYIMLDSFIGKKDFKKIFSSRIASLFSFQIHFSFFPLLTVHDKQKVAYILCTSIFIYRPLQ